jgi:ubiquinone biosynthesis protein
MASVTARYRQIVEVLVRNGLSALAARIGLRDHLPRSLRRPHEHDHPLIGPERLRTALEELGPTFVKLGQMLSTRRDLLPEDYVRELTELQDSAAPVPYEAIAASIRRELGADPHELYASFTETPLATASIGQAHRARLEDGTEVIVKVRKPGVTAKVRADLEVMKQLAALAAREWDLARDVDAEALVDGFDRMMRGELDYRTESAHAEQFRQNLADNPAVRIPLVIEELSTSEVLTEEFVIGRSITDSSGLDAAGVDRRALAHTATDALIRMVLVDGFFHADPHPGNLFVAEDSTIWLIDFGMVGRLSAGVREDLLWLLLAMSRRDEEGIVAALLRLAPPRRGVDRRRLARDVANLIEAISSHPLAEVSISRVIEQIYALMRHHRLQLPAELSAMLRMLVLTESAAVVLDPDFHLDTVLQEVMPVALVELLSPEALLRRLSSVGMQALRAGHELPARAIRLLDDYEAHGMDIGIHADDLDRAVSRLEGTADRLIAGMALSAMLVGIGSYVSAAPGRRSQLRGPSLLGAGGGAALLALYLAASAGPARRAGRLVQRTITRR